MNTTHKDLNPLNKIAKNIKEINGVSPSPTPTPSGDNVHVYPLEFDYNDRETYERGYSIYIDSTIKATILQDYLTYGTSHCYFAHIKIINSNYGDFVNLIPIFFYLNKNNVSVNSRYYDGDYYVSVYFDDDEVELEVYENESYEYTEVAISGGKLYVYTEDDTYSDSDAVSYLYNYIISNYGAYTKLRFSKYDTDERCMLTCSYKNSECYVFTGKVNNKSIALILTYDGNNYEWFYIGKKVMATADNGNLIDPNHNILYSKDFYDELNCCYNYDIQYELSLLVDRLVINQHPYGLTFNKWDYVYDMDRNTVHATSSVYNPIANSIINIDIPISDSESPITYNVTPL